MNVPLEVRLTLPDGTRLLGGEDLKLVAQYGDACNVNGDLATLRHKFDVIRQHCETVGRDYNSIHRTTRTTCVIGDTDEQAQAKIPDMMRARVALNEALIGSPDTIRKRIAAYEEAGVQELLIRFVDPTDLAAIRRFANEFIA